MAACAVVDASGSGSWTLIVHTMAGQKLNVTCPEKASTHISDVKRFLFERNVDWPVHLQVLMIRQDKDEECASNYEPAPKRQCITPHDIGLHDDSSSSMDGLWNDALLADCDLDNFSELSLFVKEMEWRDSDISAQEKAMAEEVVKFSDEWTDIFDSQTAAAIAYVLKVRSLLIESS